MIVADDDEEDKDKERKAKRRVGEIATGMAKMRLMLTKGSGGGGTSFGFTEGRRNNNAGGGGGLNLMNDANEEKTVGKGNTTNVMVKIRADMSKIRERRRSLGRDRSCDSGRAQKRRGESLGMFRGSVTNRRFELRIVG